MKLLKHNDKFSNIPNDISIQSFYRIIVVSISFALIAMLLLLCGCQNLSFTNNSNAQNANHEKYQPVFEQYKNAISTYNTKTGYLDAKTVNQISEQYQYVKIESEMPTKYSFLDLNNDGIDELLLANNNGNLINVYTLVNDVPCLAIQGIARSRYYVTEQNYILNEGSGGAMCGGIFVFRFKYNDQLNDSSDRVESLEWIQNDNSWKTIKIDITNTEGETKTEVQDAKNTSLEQYQNDLQRKYPQKNDIIWEAL